MARWSKGKQSKLELWQDDAKRSGLSEKLFLKCTLCFNEVEFQTSKRIKNKVNTKNYSRPFEVNVRAIQCGNGPYGLNKICSTFNLPPPVKHSNYKKLMDNLCLFSCDEAEEVMKSVARNVKTYLINTDPGVVVVCLQMIFLMFQ